MTTSTKPWWWDALKITPCTDGSDTYKITLEDIERIGDYIESRSRADALKEAAGVARDRKDKGQNCSCGGSLIPATGTGMIAFPYQCSRCGSYTSDSSEKNQLAEDIALSIEKLIK